MTSPISMRSRSTPAAIGDRGTTTPTPIRQNMDPRWKRAAGIVFCDHGAMTFADPYRTVPEVARLLRPGGLFAFSHGSPILSIAWALDADRAGDRLVGDYFEMHRFDDGDSIEFNLPYGEWIRLFRANGFIVEDLIEPRPAPDATSTYRDALERDWSQRWPAESIWRLRRS